MPVSKNRKNKSGKNRTRIDQHKKEGKILQPAFSQIQVKMGDKFNFSSWTNERLPELIYVVIIRAIEDQKYAITQFRRILNFILRHPQKEKFSDISISGLAKLDEELISEFISFLLSEKKIAQSLTVLRLFAKLPAKNIWDKYLPVNEPDLDIMMLAVGNTLFHQSQESTDCRWFRLMTMIAAGKMHLPREHLDNLIKYPYDVEMRTIRPFIRAAEIGLSDGLSDWSKNFWDECWKHTPCLQLQEPISTELIEYDNGIFETLKNQIIKHWTATHKTTAIDAKHDAVFGLTLYTLRIFKEVATSSSHQGLLGRLGIRTILESYLTLHYLIKKDNNELWDKWRKYGAGQAKLNALRFDETLSTPKYINSNSLEIIASEDVWEEFLDIDLGNWTNLDLRKLSIDVGKKDLYDKYYSWTSTFAHGHWGAVRESVFITCGNPLHRLHRYPEMTLLPSVIDDMILIYNLLLEEFEKVYPDFPFRIEV